MIDLLMVAKDALLEHKLSPDQIILHALGPSRLFTPWGYGSGGGYEHGGGNRVGCRVQ
jgi:hypothetical protein